MKNLRTKPAILVVGRVVGLRQHLRWFDERPLFGKRIVVTRSREQAGELVDLLESLGAEPIEAPMIRVDAAGRLRSARQGGRRSRHLRLDRLHERERASITSCGGSPPATATSEI